MLKRSNRGKTISKVMRKIMGDAKKTKSHHYQDKVSKVKKVKGRQTKNCTSEDMWKSLIRKKSTIKRKNKQKKIKSRNYNKTSRKRNLKQCFSTSPETSHHELNESRSNLDSQLSHLHIDSENYESSSQVKPDVDSRSSLQSFRPLNRMNKLNNLDGLKFVINRNPDGSATEVTFETKLVMHFKQTAPNEGGGESVPKHLNINQLTELLSEVRANPSSKSMRRTDSTSLLRYAIHNDRRQSQISFHQVTGDSSRQAVSQQSIPMSSPVSSRFNESMTPTIMKDSSVALMHMGRKP